MRYILKPKYLRLHISGLIAIFIASTTGLVSTAKAADYPFPVIGESSYTNDFYAPRSNGTHKAIDIIAGKHQKIISRTNGVITFVGYPQPSWGYAVFVEAENGNTYRYLHMNNDTPGTDDGRGGGYYAYAPDVVVGKRVVKGQLLGYVGDSGNAEETVSHLHFEVYDGDTAINPYYGLRDNSYYRSSPVVDYPKATNETLPYGSFRGGASIAYGDVDGDNVDEIVTGAGPGGQSVKVFELNGQLVRQFFPNEAGFTGGVDVATGDVDGDNVDEIITGSGEGGRYVKVFKQDGTMIMSFMPNVPEFTGGADVAAGDLDGDGIDEVITGAGPGGSYVKAYKLDGTQVSRFIPYSASFKGGVTVAAGDVTGDSKDEIITGARRSGGPLVGMFNANGSLVKSFYAYSNTFKGGVRVESANIRAGTAKDEIVTLPQSSGQSRVKPFSPNGNYIESSPFFAEEWWKGNYDIAAIDGRVLSSTGVNRRTSVRVVNGLQN